MAHVHHILGLPTHLSDGWVAPPYKQATAHFCGHIRKRKRLPGLVQPDNHPYVIVRKPRVIYPDVSIPISAVLFLLGCTQSLASTKLLPHNHAQQAKVCMRKIDKKNVMITLDDNKITK